EQGDRQALGAVFSRHLDLMFTAAFQVLGSRADAEEVVQEVCLKTLASASTFRGDSSVKNWFFKMAFNQALDHHRKKAARQKRRPCNEGKRTWDARECELGAWPAGTPVLA
ncbi:MAG: RNA polymerase sigma factor, partial [Proteobacteria bacterium]|nr:RNA polymerase sigma factor [Pseudomonadota bacterium]